jgi:hypothetical protein
MEEWRVPVFKEVRCLMRVLRVLVSKEMWYLKEVWRFSLFSLNLVKSPSAKRGGLHPPSPVSETRESRDRLEIDETHDDSPHSLHAEMFDLIDG